MNCFRGQLALNFLPDETDNASICMQLFFEEEQRKGNSVPDFGEDFFVNFAGSRESAQVIFDSNHLDLAVRFIEEFSVDKNNGGEIPGKALELISVIKEWNPTRRILH